MNELAEFSHSEAYFEGAFAFEDGKAVSENPYDFDMFERSDWDAGWYEAEGNHLYMTNEGKLEE